MKRIIGILALALSTQNALASKCEGVDRSLTERKKVELAPVLAKQLKEKSVDIVKLFRSGGWSIINVIPTNSEDGFLFFSKSPSMQHYITVWGGTALPFEEADTLTWVKKNAPGIPDVLANCFVWHVIYERNQ